MKTTSSVLLAAAGASATIAKSIIPAKHPIANSTMPTFQCTQPNGSFCVGPSLAMPILMQCENGVPKPVNCIEEAASRPLIDHYFSPCWQSSATAGDAACSKDCTVYPTNGNPFPVPGKCEIKEPATQPSFDMPMGTGALLVSSLTSSSTSVLPSTLAETTSIESCFSKTPLTTLTSLATQLDTMYTIETIPPKPSTPSTYISSTTYPIPTDVTEAVKPSTGSIPTDLSALPTATLPTYITTITLTSGTTRVHTVFSNCGKGTMVFGNATITLPTSFATGVLGSSPASTTVTLLVTTPCASAGSSMPSDMMMVAPTSTSMPAPESDSNAWPTFAHLTGSTEPSFTNVDNSAPTAGSGSEDSGSKPAASASASPSSQEQSNGAASGKEVSGFLLAAVLFAVAAWAS